MRPIRSLSRSLTLGLGLVAAAATTASAEEPVSHVVETTEAVYFQPTAFPNVVWYFPRSEIRLAPAQPPTPGTNRWQAAVTLAAISARTAGDVAPEWRGKTLVPYIVRPTEECLLAPIPEARFVRQEHTAKNRDISAASAAPVCQFSFRLPAVPSDELMARLRAEASAGTLVARQLPVELRRTSTLPWADVHAAVRDALGDAAPDALTADEIRAALDAALASDGLAAVRAAMTDAEASQFVADVDGALFVAAAGGLRRLVSIAPTGELAYHSEHLAFAM